MKNENGTIIDSCCSLCVAFQQLCVTKVDYLYVINEGILIGQITKELIINFLSKEGSLDSHVSDLELIPCPYFIYEYEIDKADCIMKEHLLESIPVVDSQNKLLYIKFFDKERYFIRELVRNDLQCVSSFFDNLDGEGKAFFNQNERNRLRAFKHLTQQEKDFEIHFGVFNKEEITKMVAYFALLEVNTTLPWVGLAVDEKYRGQHLGEMILEFAECYVKNLGCGGLILTTAAANIRGQNLYSRRGFVNYGFHVSREYFFLKRFELKIQSENRLEENNGI